MRHILTVIVVSSAVGWALASLHVRWQRREFDTWTAWLLLVLGGGVYLLPGLVWEAWWP